MHRTRIKICGLTREEDVDAAVGAGADAIGFVFYPPSPRHVSFARAAELARRVPPFVTVVGLFVNTPRAEVDEALRQVPIQLLQFHGDEEEADCAGFGRPYVKAARMRPGLDLLKYAARFPGAQGLLLDAFVEAYGGGGETFDWSLIPSGLPLPLILSGGLHAGNVGEAIRRVRPWAVDVSSGVEAAKGIKDAARITEFVAGVRHAHG
ncbi:MAG TPA: phosphoribosylanthranilate isomerase [Zoogloea sp.]|uniref:phosphoribosylanthranilate isomerase n=1 Tax=Zoogloea sp. TaxID=49181 RepID=UPI002C652526|nr:phosphoribosylanthranilate isomerase [Zoogloea sp.]HMV17827.1 phosphoribosylanthranilate isomerase [Rhodocyclaceae bacterium]HMV63074.1 phosphoribosylanthranilate isomerase [Rhodocyclaceae bacterium]HMW52736.1 phosphoribosylanthranilate isomerase [Rhodocyclaceae bacterium]HMY48095.1 phosphoribosylanthranilate isomerase [Rhodocyclaceae bacterium]HMZ77528.1 phosphoribosylanthranilate isomerase [Rhodocyclaceae bacterium]